jgi:sulfite exporter TauE/SafE
MLSSISPLGERARHSRWWLTTAAYLLGSIAGGLALGALFALLGALVPTSVRTSPVALVVVAALLLLGLALDLRVGGTELPSWRR